MNLAAINIPGQEFQWIHIFISHGKIYKDVSKVSAFFFSTALVIIQYTISLILPGLLSVFGVSLVAQMMKTLPAMWETQVQFLGQEDALEKGVATHSSILAWRIPWTEEASRLQSMGSQRVRHN